ncbi:MAG: putative concanavalin A-like lectin/glucanases superfamily protein [Prokaryotic dsDNA virus sp.]|nr:MAG: putative concanavalin A-like lectin/glucanases superfamily protein [Prokaryotic dsDNA virus sp.]|tara:strand:- start:2622 stop:4295 length:1674 start_codon:yes stop_codon:yes gene_type:complete
MSLGKQKILSQGASAAPPAIDPLANFETVTYTGNGSTQKITGYIRKGAAFNGSSSFIQSGLTLPADSTMSFSFWFFKNSTQNTSGDVYLVSDLNSSATHRRIDIRYNTSDDKIFIDIGNGSSSDQTNTAYTPPSDTWTHLVVTLDGTAVKMYINGNSTPVASYTSSVAFGTAGADPLHFGRPGVFNCCYFTGKLDQIRIFSKTLSTTEVGTLAAETYASATKSTTDIFGDSSGVALYELDENANDTGGNYNGTATNVNYLGMAFQPDLVWIKARTSATLNSLFDSIRGTANFLSSSTTTKALTTSDDGTLANTLTSFNSNGFSLGSDNGLYGVNISSVNYVAWCWYAPTSETNNDGTNTATIKKNVDAGFSIVNFTSTGASNVGHGLGAPDLILLKSVDGAFNWQVYNSISGTGNYMRLNSSDAVVGRASSFSSVTSTTFTNDWTSATVEWIAYCFKNVAGYQKIGSYTGDTTEKITTTGFEPSFLMIKRTNGVGGWIMLDNKRDTSNPRTKFLQAHLSDAEGDAASIDIDFLSDGFSTNGTNSDINNGTYIYLAIA